MAKDLCFVSGRSWDCTAPQRSDALEMSITLPGLKIAWAPGPLCTPCPPRLHQSAPVDASSPAP